MVVKRCLKIWKHFALFVTLEKVIVRFNNAAKEKFEIVIDAAPRPRQGFSKQAPSS